MIYLVCMFPDCENVARSRGLCSTHLARKLKGAGPVITDTSEHPQCAVSHCTLMANARKPGSLCEPHYQAKYRGADPEERVIRPGGWRTDRKCWVDTCSRVVQSKGLCQGHYTKARRGNLDVPAELGVVLAPQCGIEECSKRCESKGLCHTHADQLRHGRVPRKAREWGKYTRAHPCIVRKCTNPAISRDMCASHSQKATTYGLTPSQLAELALEEVCENPGCNRRANGIDHDHASGEVRGMLCSGCNSALGFLVDDEARILGLITYLRRGARFPVAA